MSDDTTEIEAERCIIGMLLRNPEYLDRLELRNEDFRDGKHRRYLSAIRARDSATKSLDDVGIAADVGCNPADVRAMRAAGGGGISDFTEYSRIVRRGAIRRNLDTALSRASSALSNGADPDKILDGLNKYLQGQVERAFSDDAISGQEALAKRIDYLVELRKRKEAGENIRTGVTTGLTRLDTYTGGLPFGVVTVEGARPKIGKSSFALQCARACAASGDHVHYFPIEDSIVNTQDRLLSQETGITAPQLRSLKFSLADVERLRRAQSNLAPALSNIAWEEAPGATGDDIVNMIRRHARKHKTKLAVVDYLQIIKAGRKQDEITKINDTLRALLGVAKEFNMAVLALSQLGRKLEERGAEHYARTGEYDGYYPQVADFKWSGAIEEICKMALLLHRPAFYDDELTDDEMLIQVALNNFGEGGEWFKFVWDGPHTRIINK